MFARDGEYWNRSSNGHPVLWSIDPPGIPEWFPVAAEHVIVEIPMKVRNSDALQVLVTY